MILLLLLVIDTLLSGKILEKTYTICCIDFVLYCSGLLGTERELFYH